MSENERFGKNEVNDLGTTTLLPQRRAFHRDRLIHQRFQTDAVRWLSPPRPTLVPPRSPLPASGAKHRTTHAQSAHTPRLRTGGAALGRYASECRGTRLVCMPPPTRPVYRG